MFGERVGHSLKKARKQVQALLGAEYDHEVVFTSCGTESDSTAILSAIKAQAERKKIITTTVEHPAILTLCEYLEKDGYTIHPIPLRIKIPCDIKSLCDHYALNCERRVKDVVYDDGGGGVKVASGGLA